MTGNLWEITKSSPKIRGKALTVGGNLNIIIYEQMLI